MSDDIISIGDARKAGYCVKGVREWHENNGRDFRDFVRNGMTIDEGIALNDAVVTHIIQVKRGSV